MGFLRNNDTYAWLNTSGPWYNQPGELAQDDMDLKGQDDTQVGPGTQTDTLTNCNNVDPCPCQYGGCTDPSFLEYDSQADCQLDNSCITPIVYGCTDPNSTNYSAQANVDDGTCISSVYGCTDQNSINYDANANVDDGSCITQVVGCGNPAATNYNPDANVDCEGAIIEQQGGGGIPGEAEEIDVKGQPGFSGYTQASGCGYSNFNQRGFGGFNDKLWFD